MNIKNDIKPGELIFIDRQNPSKGFQQLFYNPAEHKRFCVFEWVYTANPTSEIEGVVGEPVRKNLGACLARTDKLNPDFSADADIGVPDSGIAHSLGYSEESGIPFRRFFVKEQYIGRSYIPLDPEQRKFVATRKQMVDKKGIAGLTIVINDDSIVRGTQYGICGEEVEKNLLTLLTGAKGVHVRISYPMILHPCPFGETTKTYLELAGFRHNGDVEKIRQEIQKHAPMPVTLRYNSVEDLVNSIHDSKNKINPKDLCTYCATGQF
jgi:amidophosphoribosyltransferase